MSKVSEFFALSISFQQAAFIESINNQRINDKSSLAYYVGMLDHWAGLRADFWKRAECIQYLTDQVTRFPFSSLKRMVCSDYTANKLLTIAASQAAKAAKEAAKAAKPARQPKAKPINGALLYKGPSAIDGKEIAVIIVGLANGSSNTKTGSMLQTYIIRTDMKPIEAANNGQDISVCGDCKHRPSLAKNNGEAKCYVNLGKGAGMVFKALQAGNYPVMAVSEIAHLVKGKEVRFGTYGDPCAAPIEIFQDLAAIAAGFTGYTHRWRDANFNQAWSRLLMASVDNIFEQFEAVSKGYRYFRVQIGTAAPLPGEISCPASAEAGKKTTCAACLLCGGTSKKAKNIVIQDHAIGWQSRQKLALAAGLALS
jgi:hypothetical protein